MRKIEYTLTTDAALTRVVNAVGAVMEDTGTTREEKIKALEYVMGIAVVHLQDDLGVKV